MIYFTLYLPAMKHSDEWTISKLRLNKSLHKDSLLGLANTASFVPAFLHSEITWSSKLRFLPIWIPSNFCFAFSQIFSSPILTQRFSYFCPETERWHFSLFSSIAKKALCSNLLISPSIYFKLCSLTYCFSLFSVIATKSHFAFSY